MFDSISLVLKNQNLELDGQKALFWKEKSTLILADLHLGKVNHFRKNGIAIPAITGDLNFIRLEYLIEKYQPQRVLLLGDLFHSEANADVLVFKKMLKHFSSVSWFLIQGNHDILEANVMQEIGFNNVHLEHFEGPFHFSHHPAENLNSGFYNLAGHIHPGVLLSGIPGQHLRLPCFYFGNNAGLLPAFGDFTGLYIIKPGKNDFCIPISEGKVISSNATMVSN